MKFRCERDTLVDAVTTAGRAANSRGSAMAATSGIRMSVVGNRLVVTGTDLDLTVRVDIEVIGLENGDAVAPARLTADIVRSLEPGAVTLESSDEELDISAARSQFVVRTFASADFPVLPEPRKPAVTLPASTFAEGLRQVVRAASTDDSRPLLTGVIVAIEGDGSRMVATDSYRLALRDLEGTNPFPDGVTQILVPARALTEVQRLLPAVGAKEKEGEETEVGFSIGDLDASFTVGDVNITTRLLDGKFPDYHQLIPDSYPNLLRVGKASLLDGLRRVRLLVRDNTTPVRLSMRPGGVELTVVSQEVGHASEEVDADFEGEELTVAFNPSYLIDGVEAVHGDEVVLQTVDETKPATVKSPDHEDYRYLLMPVRVS